MGAVQFPSTSVRTKIALYCVVPVLAFIYGFTTTSFADLRRYYRQQVWEERDAKILSFELLCDAVKSGKRGLYVVERMKCDKADALAVAYHNKRSSFSKTRYAYIELFFNNMTHEYLVDPYDYAEDYIKRSFLPVLVNPSRPQHIDATFQKRSVDRIYSGIIPCIVASVFATLVALFLYYVPPLAKERRTALESR